MSENSSNTDTLDARQKGDIYWRKLKRYIAAEESRDILRDEEKAIARELLKEANSATSCDFYDMQIHGNEFKPAPPTSAARELQKRKIAHLMQVKKRLAVGDSAEKKLAAVTQMALKAFFNSAGFDENTGESLPSDKRIEARFESAEVFREFEHEVRYFRRNIAIDYIKGLIKDKPSGDPPVYEDEIRNLLIGISIPQEYEQVLTRVHTEYRTLKKKEADLDSLIQWLKSETEDKGDTVISKDGMTVSEAVEEYEFYILEQTRALSFAIKGCIALVESLMGKDVNPLYAAYIKDNWKIDVPSYSMDEKVNILPGYTNLSRNMSPVKDYSFNTWQDFIRAGEELDDYRRTHRSQFEEQTVTSILFGIEEMPDVLKKATTLRNSMVLFKDTDEFVRLNESEKERFYDIFTSADAMVRVSGFIIDFSLNSNQKTFGDLLEDFENYVYEMDYNIQFNVSRELERRVSTLV